MSKFPEPPSVEDLAELGADCHVLPEGTEMWRIYFRGGRHPTRWNVLRAFGPTGSRFDHHLPPPRVQGRRILYAARRGSTCLAEVFQDTRVIDRRQGEPWLVMFRLGRPVRLLDLTGTWPTRAGASSAIHSGPRPRARRWSQHVYAASPEVEGLLYRSSMDGSRPAVAIYERATDALPLRPEFDRALADPALARPLAHASTDLGYLVV